MRWTLMMLAAFLVSACVPAEGDGVAEVESDQEEAIDAEHRVEMVVNGLACPLCVEALDRRLREAFGARGVHVDLEDGTVTFGVTADHGMTDEGLRELVAEAGFVVVEVSRAPWS